MTLFSVWRIVVIAMLLPLIPFFFVGLTGTSKTSVAINFAIDKVDWTLGNVSDALVAVKNEVKPV